MIDWIGSISLLLVSNEHTGVYDLPLYPLNKKLIEYTAYSLISINYWYVDSILHTAKV